MRSSPVRFILVWAGPFRSGCGSHGQRPSLPYATCEQGKVEKQRRPLAKSSILRIFTVLRVAMYVAVRDGLLGADTAKLVDPPIVRRA